MDLWIPASFTIRPSLVWLTQQVVALPSTGYWGMLLANNP